MADVTRQPRQERAIGIDVVSPIVMGFLTTRVPLAMEAAKRKWEALDPKRQADLWKFYNDSVGRGADLTRQSLIMGDTSLRALSSGSNAALGLAGNLASANAAIQSATIGQFGESRRLDKELAYRTYVSGVTTPEEGNMVTGVVNGVSRSLNAPNQSFDDRLANGMSQVRQSMAPVITKIGNQLHRGAVLDLAVDQLRANVQSASPGALPGYNNLTPEEQVAFNNRVAELYGDLSVPALVDPDTGSAVSRASAEALSAANTATAPAPVMSGGVGARIPSVSYVQGAPATAAPAQATVVPPGTAPSTTIGTPPAAGGQPVVVTQPQPAAQVVAAPGVVSAAPVVGAPPVGTPQTYVQLPGGGMIPPPDYGYGGSAPVYQQQLSREQQFQALLLDQMADLEKQRQEAIDSGVGDRIGIDLFDRAPNRAQGAVDKYAATYASMTPEDRERANMRLTETLRMLETPGEERRDLRREERAMGTVEKADAALYGEQGSDYRVGSEGTTSNQMDELSRTLNNEYAQLASSVTANKLTGDAAGKAMAPWYPKVAAATQNMTPEERAKLLDQLSVPDPVKAAVRTVMAERDRERKAKEMFYGIGDEAVNQASKALDKAAKETLGSEYSPSDKPKDEKEVAREESLFYEPPALPTKSEAPVDKGALFDAGTPGTAAPKAVPEVTERGATGRVVQGEYNTLPRDVTLTPGRDLGGDKREENVRYRLSLAYARQGGNLDDKEALDTYINERMGRRKKKEDATNGQPAQPR